MSMWAQSLSHVLFCNPMDCSPPGSVHGIFQARIMEWVAMPSSRGSSQPRDQTQVSHTAGWFFTIWATREAYIYAYTQKDTMYTRYPRGCGKWNGFISHTVVWTLRSNCTGHRFKCHVAWFPPPNKSEGMTPFVLPVVWYDLIISLTYDTHFRLC